MKPFFRETYRNRDLNWWRFLFTLGSARRIAALLAKRKVCLDVAGNGDLLGSGFQPLVPSGDRVTTVRNVLNFVISCAVGLGEIRRRRNYNET